MEFNNDQMYRLTELEHAFLIGPAEVVVPSKDAKPLCIASTGQMMEYLSRYLWERGRGKPLAEAHDAALTYAQISNRITPEVPL